MNSKFLFSLFVMAMPYLQCDEREKIDVKEQPELQWREQSVYVYDKNQLTKLIMTNFLQLCEKENILKDSDKNIEQVEISKDKKSSYKFSKSENYIRVHSVFEAREWEDVDHLKETLFRGRIDNHVVGILRDKCTTCDFIALYNYATYQPTLIASCDTLINIKNDPHFINDQIEEIAQGVAAEKEQAKTTQDQTTK